MTRDDYYNWMDSFRDRMHGDIQHRVIPSYENMSMKWRVDNLVWVGLMNTGKSIKFSK